MASLKFGGDMQRVSAGLMGILFWILMASTGWAITITEPKAGTVFHPGDKVMVRVELTPNETPNAVIIFTGKLTNDDSPIAFEAPYEWEFAISKHFIGEGKITAAAKFLNGDLAEAEVPITVILPPTTKVVSIGASFTGTKETFLQLARKPSGELVPSGTSKDDRLSIGAAYSDGVGRNFIDNPDVTYKSLNEKVAIVFPPGQGKDSRGKVIKGYALVRATGPGKTDIIVQYGEFTDRVTVNVKECPYIEGKMKLGCPLR